MTHTAQNTTLPSPAQLLSWGTSATNAPLAKADSQVVRLASRKKSRMARRASHFPLTSIKEDCFDGGEWFMYYTISSGVLGLEAHSQKAVRALAQLGLHHGNAIVVSTRKGANFYVRLQKGVYARSDFYTADENFEGIVVRASGSRFTFDCTPTTGVELERWKSIGQTSAVGQDIVDAVFKFNGVEAPRPVENNNSLKKLRAVLGVTSTLYMPPQDWLRWLKAIYNECIFLKNGLEIANGWSIGYENYPGFDAMAHLWDSFEWLEPGEEMESLKTVVRDLGNPEAVREWYAN